MLARIRAARLVPTAVGVLVAITVTLTWVTVLHPVLEHDDWDMLLPDGSPFVLDHASRVLHEGRWLNYWWWRLGSQHLGSHVVTLGFWLGWLLATATLTRLLARDWWAVPIAVAVFASPMITQISYWPATLMLAMLVLAVAGIALTATRGRPRLHLALLGVAVLALALGYPPFALLLLPLLAVLHREASWRRLALVGGTLAAGYVGAILLVYVLNDIRFGVFGMEIQAWRAPHPVHGPRSLAHNLVMVLHDNLQVARFTILPLLAVAVCVVLALRAGADRRWLVLAAAFVLAWGLSGATTVVNGVGLPIRSVSWTWPFGVIAIVWTLRTGPRSTRLIAGLALIAFAAWGRSTPRPRCGRTSGSSRRWITSGRGRSRSPSADSGRSSWCPGPRTRRTAWICRPRSSSATVSSSAPASRSPAYAPTARRWSATRGTGHPTPRSSSARRVRSSSASPPRWWTPRSTTTGHRGG
ncbi:MAG: hypothetical protein ACXVDH_00235 [Nocardioides sp.]